MRFIVDAQLPPALSRFLIAQGHDSHHVEDLGMRHASDTAIWEHALSVKAAVITKDEDFAIRVEMIPTGPAIIWIRRGNCTKAALMEWFEPLFPRVIQALNEGNRLIEVV